MLFISVLHFIWNVAYCVSVVSCKCMDEFIVLIYIVYFSRFHKAMNLYFLCILGDIGRDREDSSELLNAM